MGWEREPAGAAAPSKGLLAVEDLAPDGLGPYAETLGLVGQSRAMLELGARIQALARSSATVLVQGETGTGKELIARGLHRLGPRAERPFLPHNFAAIPDSLVESELFGHARGAFTGAHADRRGLFELAHGGTLFLDEIGDASPSVQSRLLRVLQEGEVRRVGDGAARRVDVRIVAATHRDLAAEVRRGRVRADLFYRLHVLTIRAPALRERGEDIPLLVAHGLARWKESEGPRARQITEEALDLLARHSWPGNVRELEATLERALHALGRDGTVTAASLGEGFPSREHPMIRESASDLRGRTRALEAELIRSAIDRAGGNKTRAARALGLTRQGLWKKLRRLSTDSHAESNHSGAEASEASLPRDPGPDWP